MDLDDSTKLLSSSSLWDAEDRTIIAFGDVYFTDEAVDTILEIQSDEIEWFGRPGASSVSNKVWGEIFGVTFPAEAQAQLAHATAVVKVLFDQDKIRKCKAWETYCQLQGLPFEYQRTPAPIAANFTVIDDETDDFDNFRQYERWLSKHGED
jgi:hypothetical protein